MPNPLLTATTLFLTAGIGQMPWVPQSIVQPYPIQPIQIVQPAPLPRPTTINIYNSGNDSFRSYDEYGNPPSRDGYGCNRADGYQWCATKQSCIRPEIEDCAYPENSPYYRTDDDTIRSNHDCVAAEGYYWCEARQSCIKTGDTCTPSWIGSTYRSYHRDGFGCRTWMGERWCDSKQSCFDTETETCPNDRNARRPMRWYNIEEDSSVVLPPHRDSFGCRTDYGYQWCQSMDKCIRPWEERCLATTDYYTPSSCPILNNNRCIGSQGYRWCEASRSCIRIGKTCK